MKDDRGCGARSPSGQVCHHHAPGCSASTAAVSARVGSVWASSLGSGIQNHRRDLKGRDSPTLLPHGLVVLLTSEGARAGLSLLWLSHMSLLLNPEDSTIFHKQGKVLASPGAAVAFKECLMDTGIETPFSFCT